MLKSGEISTRAVRRIKTQGLSLPEEPESAIPVLPPDITALHSEELMVLFGEVCSWLDYVQVQHAVALIDQKTEDQRLDEQEAKVQIMHKNEKSVAIMKAYTYGVVEADNARDSALMAFAHAKMLETIVASLERKRFLISRELTRRSYGND